jgi:hypothetical protein
MPRLPYISGFAENNINDTPAKDVQLYGGFLKIRGK